MAPDTTIRNSTTDGKVKHGQQSTRSDITITMHGRTSLPDTGGPGVHRMAGYVHGYWLQQWLREYEQSYEQMKAGHGNMTRNNERHGWDKERQATALDGKYDTNNLKTYTFTNRTVR
jgi:hypothetical protein